MWSDVTDSYHPDGNGMNLNLVGELAVLLERPNPAPGGECPLPPPPGQCATGGTHTYGTRR